MSGGNTIVEGIIMIVLGFFMYMSAQNATPLAGITTGVCDNPLVKLFQNLLGQNPTSTCNKINLNASIISNTSNYAIVTGFSEYSL